MKATKSKRKNTLGVINSRPDTVGEKTRELEGTAVEITGKANMSFRAVGQLQGTRCL